MNLNIYYGLTGMLPGPDDPILRAQKEDEGGVSKVKIRNTQKGGHFQIHSGGLWKLLQREWNTARVILENTTQHGLGHEAKTVALRGGCGRSGDSLGVGPGMSR